MTIHRGAAIASFLLVLSTQRQVAAATIVGPPVQVGLVSSTLVREASGIVGSSSLNDVVWVHNDSGDSARFFAVSTSGAVLGQFSLTGAVARDWEDIAIGPRSGGGSYLYLGDIGDNDRVRSEISIFRVVEPTSSAGGSISSANYVQARLTYPGGARNSESLMVDPISGDVYIVTKSPSSQVYRAAATIFDNPAQVTALTSLGNLNAPLFQPSAADISPDGLHILVRDRSTRAFLFERTPGQSVWDALQMPGIPVTLAAEPQGEAIGWAADGSGFFTLSEEDNQGPRPLYFYSVTVPEPGTCALLGCGLLALAASRLTKRTRRGRSIR